MRYIGLSINKGLGGGGSVKTEEFTRSSGITTNSSNNVTEITLGDKVYTNVNYDAGGVGVVTGFTETIGGVSKMWDITYDSEFLVTNIDQYIPPPPPASTWPVNLNSISWTGKAPLYKFEDVVASSSYGTTRGFFLKPDGTAIFTMGNDRRIRKHIMSTPFDIGTASYDSISTSLYASSGYAKGLYFKPDGTKVFWIDNAYIFVGTLSSPWDILTFSYQGGIDLSSYRESNAQLMTLTFKPDGTRFYVAESGSQVGGWTGSTSYSNIFSFQVQSAWDIFAGGGAGYIQKNTSTWNNASHEGYLNGISFSANGDRLFCNSGSNTYTTNWELTTPWDISTATSTSFGFRTWYQLFDGFQGNGLNIQWKSDGSVYYVIGTADNMIGQFEPYNQLWYWPSGAGNQDNPANDADYLKWCCPDKLFGSSSAYACSWSSDGTKFFHSSSYSVKILPVGTAYDAKTITSSGQSYVGTQLGYGPKSLRFKPDGTRFWLGPEVQNGVVGQYEIPTPWDLSSVPNNGNPPGYTYTLSVAGVRGAFVSEDGVNIYHSNSSGAIYWHRCSTAWDLSTASYQGYISNLPATATQFIISDDGTTLISMYTSGTTNTAYKFTLSSAWNITTLNTTPDQTLDMNTLGIPHSQIVGSCWAYGGGKWFIYPYYAAHGFEIDL